MKRYTFRHALWSIYFFSFFGAQYFSNWWTLRISGIRGGTFSDLGAVLRWTDCFRTVGNTVYGPEDGRCGGYIYGSTLLRVFDVLGISASQTKFWGLFGGAFICVSLGVLATLFTNKEGLNAILVGLVLSSPGLWLLIERGNIDGLIFLLVLASSVLIARNFEIPAILLIATGALFKFYTLPLLLVLAVIGKSKRTRAMALIAFLVIIPFIAIDYFNIQSAFPQTWFVSFGAPSLGFWINLFAERFAFRLLDIGAFVGHVLGLAALALCAVMIRKLSNSRKQNFTSSNIEKMNRNWADSLFLIFGSVFTTCYLFGMNYDYRLIFAAVSGIALISRKSAAHLTPVIKVSLLLGLWLSSYSFGVKNDTSEETVISFILIQFFGDIALSFFVAILILELLETLKREMKILQAT